MVTARSYKTLVDAVLADGFDETDRTAAKVAVNHRLGLLWNFDEWTFTRGHANVTVTANSATVTNMPADYALTVDLFRADGERLTGYEEYREFADRYLGTSNASTGLPEAFTSLGGTITVGPTSSETSSSYLLVYEKTITALSADGDIPGIPGEHDQALVFGGKSDLFSLKQVLLADHFEQLWQSELQSMGRKYLTEVRGARWQTPAYRPGSGRWSS